jgi:hypothetical protein
MIFYYFVTVFRITFQLNTRLQWLQEILEGAQMQSTCNTIAAPLEMLPRHRLYRSTAMTNTATLLTRVCCWAVDIPASLRCSSACKNYQQHPQSDVDGPQIKTEAPLKLCLLTSPWIPIKLTTLLKGFPMDPIGFHVDLLDHPSTIYTP